MIRTGGIPYGVLDIRYYTKDEVNDLVEGASFDFFLNDTASDIDTYFVMDPSETDEAESSFSDTITGDAFLIDTFATSTAEPTFTELMIGIYSLHIHAETTVGANVKTVRLYYELYKRTHPGAVETLLVTSEESSILTNVKDAVEIHGSLTSDTILDSTDRLVVKIYANIEDGAPPRNTDPLVTLYAEGNLASRFEVKTTISAFDDRYVEVTGDTMTGNLDMGDNDIIGIDHLQSTGSTASGTDAIALGGVASATGAQSIAIGLVPTASATGAIALGSGALASNTHSVAIGQNSQATGSAAFAMIGGHAIGAASISIGAGTSATGISSVAIGTSVITDTGNNVIGFGESFTNSTDSSCAIGFGQIDVLIASGAVTHPNNATLDTGSGSITTTGNLSDGVNSLTIANAKTAFDHVTADGTSHSGVDGVVTIHSDVTDAGSGLIISDAERTNLGTAYDYSQIGHLPLAGGTVTGITDFTGVPTGVGYNQASLIVNPASATANYLLQSWSVANSLKAKIDEDGDFTTGGLITVTKQPVGTGAGSGCIYINPAASMANYTLLGLSVNGNERFRIDEDGDLHFLDAAVLVDASANSVTVANLKTAFDYSQIGHLELDGEATDVINGTFDLTTTGTLSAGLTKLTGIPTATTVSGGVVYINPASATSDYTLLGLAVNGVEKARIDEDGDFTTIGSISGVTTITASDNISIASGKKILLEGSTGDTYLTYNSATPAIEVYLNNIKVWEF